MYYSYIAIREENMVAQEWTKTVWRMDIVLINIVYIMTDSSTDSQPSSGTYFKTGMYAPSRVFAGTWSLSGRYSDMYGCSRKFKVMFFEKVTRGSKTEAVSLRVMTGACLSTSPG